MSLQDGDKGFYSTRAERSIHTFCFGDITQIVDVSMLLEEGRNHDKVGEQSS